MLFWSFAIEVLEVSFMLSSVYYEPVSASLHAKGEKCNQRI